MEILDVLRIILNNKFLSDNDRKFIEKCVKNRTIIDLNHICDIISNYFIHVRTKSTDNVCGNVCFDMLSSLKYCFLTYLSFKEGISDDYKVYPINVNDGSERLFKEYLKRVFEEYFCNRPLTYFGDKTMVYRYPNYTKLLTPDMVLKENYQKALKNGLISDKRMPFGIGYNEIVFMDDNKGILPIGVWVRKGNEDIYKKALNLSKKTNLPLVVIDTLRLKEKYKNQKMLK